LDTVQISVGEKLYQSMNEWTRFDSVSIDTSLQAWFTFFVHDSLLIKGFKEGDYQTFYLYLDDSYMKYFCFQCLEIDSYLLDRFGAIGFQVTFIANSDISMAMVDKPNIYLYPTKKTRMTVSLDLPEGGKVTESIPDYPKKWKNIRVKPDGTINRKYDFLFYEADLPGDWQKDKGWCIAQKDLSFFFKSNLCDYGFNKKEIADFIEYWIPRLKDKPYYIMYPQHTAKINSIVPLKINKNVDSLLRLFYFIEGSDNNMSLKKPQIPDFKRDGFVVTEWGVSLE
ncbi:MAG: hypothetical protein J7M01_03450, partial [Candidatus Marinimicrobia bacterium]|nr:hypothetical protein [Candidatus Neomarinimicrobiota bacterium]